MFSKIKEKLEKDKAELKMHRKEIACQNSNVDEFIDLNAASHALKRKETLKAEQSSEKKKTMLVD